MLIFYFATSANFVSFNTLKTFFDQHSCLRDEATQNIIQKFKFNLTLVPHFLKTTATCSEFMSCKSVSSILSMWSPERNLPSMSAAPPGTIVFTTTPPVALPPTIPKPNPRPVLVSSIVSTCDQFISCVSSVEV